MERVGLRIPIVIPHLGFLGWSLSPLGSVSICAGPKAPRFRCLRKRESSSCSLEKMILGPWTMSSIPWTPVQRIECFPWIRKEVNPHKTSRQMSRTSQSAQPPIWGDSVALEGDQCVGPCLSVVKSLTRQDTIERLLSEGGLTHCFGVSLTIPGMIKPRWIMTLFCS